MKIVATVTRELDVCEEDFKLLKEACEEGDTQMFNEITEIELGEISVKKVK